MEVLIFKTNIDKMQHVRHLYSLLRAIKGILKWNLDTEDIDKILRVETAGVAPANIETVLQNAGYYCKELKG